MNSARGVASCRVLGRAANLRESSSSQGGLGKLQSYSEWCGLLEAESAIACGHTEWTKIDRMKDLYFLAIGAADC